MDDIAILGGTFDPIHVGHINVAENAAKWLKIKEVILLPAHIPPHKATPSISSNVRAEMVELVCRKNPLLTCDSRELYRDIPSYTVETLTELKREHPRARIFFLIGMDSLLHFTTWYKWQDILTLCHLVVTTRPGYDLSQLPEEAKALLKHHHASIEDIQNIQAGKLVFAPSIQFDISSTDIRQRIRNCQPLTGILTGEVAQYIKANKLYL